MKFVDVYAQSVGRNSTFVFYGLDDGPFSMDEYSYKIYSGRNKSDLTLVGEDIKVNHYVDKDMLSESPYTTKYYKIELHGLGGVLCVSQIIPVNQQTGDLKAKKMASNYKLVLDKKSGSEAMYYVRRKSGMRCPVCYDDKIKASVVSNCENCGGVGIMDGYYDPIEFKGMFSRKTGKLDPGIPTSDGMPGSVTMSNAPIATVKDVIYEVPRNRLWRVQSVDSLEHNSNVYAQKLMVTSIPNTSALFDRITEGINVGAIKDRAKEVDGTGVML